MYAKAQCAAHLLHLAPQLRHAQAQQPLVYFYLLLSHASRAPSRLALHYAQKASSTNNQYPVCSSPAMVSLQHIKMPLFALGLPRTSLTDLGTAMGCAHNASTYESAGAAGSPAAPGAPDANDPWFRPCTHACMVRGSMCRCPSEARKHAYLQLAFLGLGRLRKYVND